MFGMRKFSWVDGDECDPGVSRDALRLPSRHGFGKSAASPKWRRGRERKAAHAKSSRAAFTHAHRGGARPWTRPRRTAVGGASRTTSMANSRPEIPGGRPSPPTLGTRPASGWEAMPGAGKSSATWTSPMPSCRLPLPTVRWSGASAVQPNTAASARIQGIQAVGVDRSSVSCIGQMQARGECRIVKR